METTGQFDPDILQRIREMMDDGADDNTIKAEIMRTDARFIPISNDSQTAEMYIAHVKQTRSGSSNG
jgi:hypothetical protein